MLPYWDAGLAWGCARAWLGLLLHHAPAPAAHGCFLHPHSAGAVMFPWCFYGWEGCRKLSPKAPLCCSSQSWKDPGGSRGSDDPSCVSDPDWDIFKQGIKIDSG